MGGNRKGVNPKGSGDLRVPELGVRIFGRTTRQLQQGGMGRPEGMQLTQGAPICHPAGFRSRSNRLVSPNGAPLRVANTKLWLRANVQPELPGPTQEPREEEESAGCHGSWASPPNRDRRPALPVTRLGGNPRPASASRGSSFCGLKTRSPQCALRPGISDNVLCVRRFPDQQHCSFAVKLISQYLLKLG